ncbi:hypothetical protein GCM10023185_23240 [Hymenobacter saemangeumensis]|uniref:XRE family transcriptional regulator n=1 Tax=Hymenobacter saemangeumensis TaxID=1084522 RepID=A0ABP8IFU5_9BACT
MAPKSSETINQRFAQLIKQLGISKNAFALSLGKTASVIQHLMDGRNKPGYDLLYKVFEIYPNVSRDWLLLGKGPMMLDAEPAEALPPKASPAIPPTVKQEALEFEELEIPAPRRAAAGNALQPADIAATLALAASATVPARASVTPPQEQSAPIPDSTSAPAPAPAPAAPQPTALPPTAAPAAPAPAPAAPADASLALALQTQHLQHQLALAELRNQHLLEQQQMLREMLELTRKAV